MNRDIGWYDQQSRLAWNIGTQIQARRFELWSRERIANMIDHREMVSRILATLEEAGCERANPLLNTVIDPAGDVEEKYAFQRALLDLLSQNRIGIRLTSIPHGDQPLSDDAAKQAIANIPDSYKFDPDRRVWTDMRFAKPPFFQLPEPEVVLTEAGKRASIELLESRGYEWWRQEV